METLYKILVDERERDARRYWTIFAVLSVVNSGLFGVVAATDPAPRLTLSACALGGAVCLLWIGGALRMVAWIRWWEDRLERLEPEYFARLRESAGLPSWYTVFAGRRLPLGFNGLSTRLIGWLLPFLFLVAWSALFWMEFVPEPVAESVPTPTPPAAAPDPPPGGFL